jgi:glycosyltransferase 2 family protein
VLVIVGIATSVFFGWFSLRGVDFRVVWQTLRSGRYAWLLPSVALVACAVWIRAVRWRLLFAPATRPPLKPTAIALLIGYFFNQILPVRAGEAARIVALHQETGTSRAEAVATAVVERAYDIVSLIALLLGASPFLPRIGWLFPAIVLGGALLCAAVAAALLVARYGERPVRILLRPLARFPRVESDAPGRIASNLVVGMHALRAPRQVVIAFGLTLLSWAATAVAFWTAIIATGIHVASGAALLVVIATNLALVIPSLPAAVGVFEAATLVALRPYGVGDSRGLSCAIVLHALNVFPFLVAGPLAMHAHVRLVRRRWR